jgi:hypothetical protein
MKSLLTFSRRLGTKYCKGFAPTGETRQVVIIWKVMCLPPIRGFMEGVRLAWYVFIYIMFHTFLLTLNVSLFIGPVFTQKNTSSLNPSHLSPLLRTAIHHLPSSRIHLRLLTRTEDLTSAATTHGSDEYDTGNSTPCRSQSEWTHHPIQSFRPKSTHREAVKLCYLHYSVFSVTCSEATTLFMSSWKKEKAQHNGPCVFVFWERWTFKSSQGNSYNKNSW